MFRNFFAALFLFSALILLLWLARNFWLQLSQPTNQLATDLALIVLLLADAIAARYLLSKKRWKSRYLLPLTMTVAISCIVTGSLLALGYVNQQLEKRSYSGIYDDCYPVWAARGLVREGPDITPDGSQNSIESIRLAFDSGARGTEVDVYFDTDRGEFIVSHDYPYNLKNGALLTLEALFKATGNRGYYWLDFKKLRHLNDLQLAQSVRELQRLTLSTDLKRLIYVEGEAPFSLAAFRDAGFHTIFDTHPLADSNPLTPMIINIYKLFFYFGNFSVMAMNYGVKGDPIYGQRTQRLLDRIPLFIYHVVDDHGILANLSESRAVRVILVQNHSLNRYRVNSCSSHGRRLISVDTGAA